MGCDFHYCPCKDLSLTDDDIPKCEKKREQDRLRREYIQNKGYHIKEIWECQWYKMLRKNEKGGKDFVDAISKSPHVSVLLS